MQVVGGDQTDIAINAAAFIGPEFEFLRIATHRDCITFIRVTQFGDIE